LLLLLLSAGLRDIIMRNTNITEVSRGHLHTKPEYATTLNTAVQWQCSAAHYT
jgi:hypothetical protein